MKSVRLSQQAKDLRRLSDYCWMAKQFKQARYYRTKAALMRRDGSLAK